MKVKLPSEMTVFDGDKEFLVRFDYDPGERQWFNPLLGEGSPGYDATVTIYQINIGHGWEDAGIVPVLNLVKYEEQVLEQLQELEREVAA